MTKSLMSSDFYQGVRHLVEQSRQKTAAAINFVMVETYWHLGRLIVEEEQSGSARAAYGERLLQRLAEQLTLEFGPGFQERNLRHMRSFYQVFSNWNALRSELSWTHYRLLMKVENERARDFYIREAIESQWSTRQLERQINSFYFERLLASQDKAPVMEEAAKNVQPIRPEDVLKDPFVLEFLQLRDNASYLEKELEAAILDNLHEFLLELGRGFSFVGRQKRITTENGKHYYIDLVFYNFILKCFVLIDLKVGGLDHSDIGQMDMYVRFYEDKWRKSDDNPTIGIILCSQKDQTIVKYSILEESRQLFASRYKLYLPTEEELTVELQREIEEFRRMKNLNP